MSRKSEYIELANVENKQFDSGEKGENHRFEKRLDWFSFFSEECLALDAWLDYCALLCLFRFVLFLLLQENQVVIILLRPEENMG